MQGEGRRTAGLDVARTDRLEGAAGCRPRSPGALLAVALLLVLPGAASAAQVSFGCAHTDVVNSAWSGPITFTYDGDAQGTLKVDGVFGPFTIPARRAPLQIQGQKGEAIDAVQKARVKLPSLAALEGCIGSVKGALEAGPAGDAFANARDACLAKLPAEPSGVEAVVEIRLGIFGVDDGSGEDGFVVLKLRYEGQSRLPGNGLSVEAFPAQCKLKK